MIFEYLDGSEGCSAITETQRLYFKAFSTTAFALWSRIDELVNLQIQHVRFSETSPSGQPYHEFSLIFRKTNKDPTKGERYELCFSTLILALMPSGTSGQIYHVPSQPTSPEIDCYAHLNAWKSHMESLLSRPLQSQDFVFPALASTGRVKFGESISRSAFETLMNKVVDKSGVLDGRNGRYTTHCFRRGGAQYRFMWAPHKWSLKAVKWWGGWSSNENVGTVMRYLLDELMAYEEGYMDIMMDQRHSERHETFMGGPSSLSTTPLVSRAAVQPVIDASWLETTITSQIKEILTPVALRILRGSDEYADLPRLPAIRLSPSPPTSPTPLPSPSLTPPPVAPEPPAIYNQRSERPNQVPTASGPPRIPIIHTMDDILQLWREGDPDKGVLLPLSEWEFNYDPSDYPKSEAMKFSNIRILYEEYTITYKGDSVAFHQAYPGLWGKYTKLLHRVRKARIDRGETRPRKRKAVP
ncbi:hypothetical protein ONZ45_g15254 [Pleurotus djamor]|nr:hypothetical protein ONZ45_g15254 [Pleurotus djamor]